MSSHFSYIIITVIASLQLLHGCGRSQGLMRSVPLLIPLFSRHTFWLSPTPLATCASLVTQTFTQDQDLHISSTKETLPQMPPDTHTSEPLHTSLIECSGHFLSDDFRNYSIENGTLLMTFPFLYAAQQNKTKTNKQNNYW